MGGTGGGPGEFAFVNWAAMDGDSLFLYDPIQRRLTTLVLADTLKFVRVTMLNVQSSLPYQVVGRLRAETWLVSTPLWSPDDPSLGFHSIQQSVGILDSRVQTIRWTDRVDAALMLRIAPEAAGRRGPVGLAAFSSRLVTSGRAGQVIVGVTSSDTIRLVGAEGEVRTLRLGLSRRPVTSAAVAAARDRDIRLSGGSGRPFLDAKYERGNLPRHLPYFDDAILDEDGMIWVRRDKLPDGSSAEYLVLSSSGVHVSTVTLPGTLRVTQVGSDFIVGIEEDEDGLQSVSVRKLTRR